MGFTLEKTKPERATARLLAVSQSGEKIKRHAAVDRLDQLLKGQLKRILKAEQFKGKLGQLKLIHTHGQLPCDAVLIVGSEQDAKGDLVPNQLEQIRQSAARAAHVADQRHYDSMSWDFTDWPHDGFKEAERIQAAVEGIILSTYKFQRYRTADKNNQKAASYQLLGVSSNAANRKAVQRGEAIAAGTILARDLVNTPAGDMTPNKLAQAAQQIRGVSCRIYKKAEIARLKMHAYLAVAAGSAEPPVLIHMTYHPKAKTKKSVAIVGKGVTFDSGGLSIKPAHSMETMKDDMAGGAAAIGLMQTLSQLKPKCTVHVVVAATENMPSGSAVKPGDIATAMNGKTIEILNTDAEGRLTLADALHFVIQKKPDVVIDLATLTGACLVALGERCSAIMSNDDDLVDALIDASELSGEMFWPLPLIDEYGEQIKSPIADVKNIGGRWGGTITAGLFLREFVGDARWAHIDIAGPSWTDKPLPYSAKGGTGCLVSTLTQFILNY